LNALLSASIDISASMNDSSSSGRALRYPQMTSARGLDSSGRALSRKWLSRGALDDSGRGLLGLDSSGKASGRGLDSSGKASGRGLDSSGKASQVGFDSSGHGQPTKRLGLQGLDGSGRGLRGLDSSGKASGAGRPKKPPVGLIARGLGGLDRSDHGSLSQSAGGEGPALGRGSSMPALTLGGSGGGSGGGYSNEMGVLKASSSVEQYAPSETSAFQANLDEKTGRFLARFTLSQVSAPFSLSLSAGVHAQRTKG
jgi:hypothetical protein